MATISKSELKKNDLLELVKLAVYFFKNNLKVVFITLASISFIILTIIIISAINLKNNKISAEILAQGINAYHSEKQEAEDKKRIVEAIGHFKEITEKYQNTQSAPIAFYYLGTLYYKLNDYAQSLNYYQKFIEKYSNHKLKDSVSEGMAYVYESQGKYDEAINICNELIRQNSGTLDMDKVKLNLGRLYELKNQIDKAREIYLQIDNDEAKFRVSNLKEKL